MPTLTSFSLPAFIQDFAPGSTEDVALKSRWNTNVSGWIQQAMPGAPSYFYDPLTTDIPNGSQSVPVTWGAFPGRLDQNYSSQPPNPPTGPYNLTQTQIYSLADLGVYSDSSGVSQSFPNIPVTICPQADWGGSLKTFGPYGPRGWLDEYCEWSAARDANGNLVRVDFACENPEYWYTLWKVSRHRVCSLYESVLNFDAPASRQISVSVEDLQLTVNGVPVIDPETGLSAYDPLNKWNNSPISLRTGAAKGFTGGAMHLTSTPNTLQTELGLAGAATVQYQPPQGTGNSNAQYLICCGNYGQEYRHSDPHIGQTVNQVVGGQFVQGSYFQVCLANPVGLYLQSLTNPAAFSFGPAIDPNKLPSGAQASDVWQVLRGSVAVIDPVTQANFPGQMILHAVCQIPSAWLAVYPNITLADIQINSQPILWAGQIANQFNVGLFARPLPVATAPPPAQCSSVVSPPGAPLQCMFSQLWDAYYSQVENAPTGQQMSLASNTTFIAPQLPPNGAVQYLTLTCTTPSTSSPGVAFLLADGSGPDPSITVAVVSAYPRTYAVPGNSFPGNYTALGLEVTIPNGAQSGLRGVTITDTVSGQNTLPAAIYIGT